MLLPKSQSKKISLAVTFLSPQSTQNDVAEVSLEQLQVLTSAEPQGYYSAFEKCLNIIC